MFSKIVVLYEIYSKKLQWPDTFGTSLYIVKVILNNPKIILYNIAFSRGKAPNNPVMNYTRVQYFLFFFYISCYLNGYLIFSCLNVNKLSPSLVSISCTETCNKYSVTVIFLLYFIQVYNHNFSKHSKLNSCSILMKFLPTERQKRELCNFLWLFLNIFWKHRF